MKKCLWLLLMVATACAPGIRGENSYETRSTNYSFELPEQWVKVNAGRHFMMTKEGPFNQYILIQQRHVEEPFRHTKRMFNRGMLPQEAAQVVLDEIASDQGVMNFRIIENRPAKLSQYDGFRVVFTYKTTNGSAYKTIYNGFLSGDWFYSVRYNVSEKHESLNEIESFEKVLSSFKIEDA